MRTTDALAVGTRSRARVGGREHTIVVVLMETMVRDVMVGEETGGDDTAAAVAAADVTDEFVVSFPPPPPPSAATTSTRSSHRGVPIALMLL